MGHWIMTSASINMFTTEVQIEETTEVCTRSPSPQPPTPPPPNVDEKAKLQDRLTVPDQRKGTTGRIPRWTRRLTRENNFSPEHHTGTRTVVTRTSKRFQITKEGIALFLTFVSTIAAILALLPRGVKQNLGIPIIFGNSTSNDIVPSMAQMHNTRASMSGFCSVKEKCDAGWTCNLDYGFTGFCEICPTSYNVSCTGTGFINYNAIKLCRNNCGATEENNLE